MPSRLIPDVYGITTYHLQIDGNDSTMDGDRFFVEAWHHARQAIDQGAKRVVVIRVEQVADEPLVFTPLYVVTAPEETA